MAGEQQDEFLIPIFFINGQLESGKTTFIEDIIQAGQFDEAAKKLLIVFEFGEKEYDKDMLKEHGFDYVELTKDDLNKKRLEELDKAYDPWAIVVEYNGMWEPSLLDAKILPKGWALYQSITIMDAESFQVQWKNMQSIMAETVKTAESVIFKKCDLDSMDLGSFRRSMKALNPGIDVIFEDKDGQIISGVNDVLPYDMSQDVIDVEDDDFGIWFIDARERKDAYIDKIFTFNAQVLKNSQMESDEAALTRRAMMCCEDDIAVVGYITVFDDASKLSDKDWINATVRVEYEPHSAYNMQEGPVLRCISYKPSKAPEKEVVYF